MSSSQDPSRSRSPSLQVTAAEEAVRPVTPAEQQTSTTYSPIQAARPSLLSTPDSSRRPSIRIRRFPSYQSASQSNLASQTSTQDHAFTNADPGAEPETTGRRRSSSEPQRMFLNPPEARSQRLSGRVSLSHMPNITEGASQQNVSPPLNQQPVPAVDEKSLRRSRGRLFRTSSNNAANVDQRQEEYDSGLVDVLDLVGMAILQLMLIHTSIPIANYAQIPKYRPLILLPMFKILSLYLSWAGS